MRASIRPIVTVCATIILMGLSLYGVLIAVARSGDDRQRQIEETIVQSALAQLSGRLAVGLHQNAYWNTAYDAMSEHLDAAWVREQLVPDTAWSNTTITLIADGRSRLIYVFDRKNPDDDLAALQTSPAIASLVSKALGASQRLPIAATAYVRLRNHFYLAAVQQIVPDDARATRPLAKHFVLGYLAPFDGKRLNALQRGFHIAAMTISSRPIPNGANMPLVGGSGTPVAYLTWHAAEPGRVFANEVAPFALAGFILMGTLQLLILKSWLKSAQRMRDEGVARTMFLANVSHELRTPLNAIIGFSECMHEQMFGPLAPKYREYVNDILMSGRYLLGIVDDVLDLTQLNSTDTIALEPLKLTDAVTRPLRMLGEYAKADAITIAFTDRSQGAIVLANQKAISQLLLNLGSNAVKFSPCGSTVEVTLQLSPRTVAVELIVRDRGAGIPQDKLRLVGKPFVQVHNATARKPGSGLGLAIVRTLTERLGGELSLQSAPGEGTTATVRLPIVAAEETAHPAGATLRAVNAGSSAS